MLPMTLPDPRTIRKVARNAFMILFAVSFFGFTFSTLSAKRASLIFTFRWRPMITRSGIKKRMTSADSVNKMKLKRPWYSIANPKPFQRSLRLSHG